MYCNHMENEVEVYKVASHIIAEGFKSAGIKDGDEFVSLKKLLTARKMTVDKFGEEHFEDDNTAIGRGVELTLRLRRLLDNKVEEVKGLTVEHKISSEDISRLESIAKELKSLEQKLSKDKVQQGHVIDVAIDNGVY